MGNCFKCDPYEDDCPENDMPPEERDDLLFGKHHDSCKVPRVKRHHRNRKKHKNKDHGTYGL